MKCQYKTEELTTFKACSKTILENLTFAELVNKYVTFYGSHGSISCLQEAATESHSETIQIASPALPHANKLPSLSGGLILYPQTVNSPCGCD